MASGIVPVKLSTSDCGPGSAWGVTIRPASDHQSNRRRQLIDDVSGRTASPGVEDQAPLCNSHAPSIDKSAVARVDGNESIPQQGLEDAQGHGVPSKSPTVLLVMHPIDVPRGETL